MEVKLSRLGFLFSSLLELITLKGKPVNEHLVEEFLDTWDIFGIKKEITEIVKVTIFVVLNFMKILLISWKSRLCISTHYCKQEYPGVIESDMTFSFSSKILPYFIN